MVDRSRRGHGWGRAKMKRGKIDDFFLWVIRAAHARPKGGQEGGRPSAGGWIRDCPARRIAFKRVEERSSEPKKRPLGNDRLLRVLGFAG